MTLNALAPITQHSLISELRDLCIFDLETTGVNVHVDRIVTSYIGRINRAGQITGSYSWLVNPGVPIDPGAAAIHGISDEVAARDGQDAATAVAEMLAVLRKSIGTGRPTMAYNASFDLSMLNAEAVRYGLEPIDFDLVIDPYLIDKAIDRYRKGSRKLIDTARHYGVDLSEDAAHDAEADAVATGRVGWKILERTPDQTVRQLHDSQVVWAADQAASFQSYLRRVKDPEAVIDGTWPVRTAPTPAADAI